jgi:hypothetical protein
MTAQHIRERGAATAITNRTNLEAGFSLKQFESEVVGRSQTRVGESKFGRVLLRKRYKFSDTIDRQGRVNRHHHWS